MQKINHKYIGIVLFSFRTAGPSRRFYGPDLMTRLHNNRRCHFILLIPMMFVLVVVVNISFCCHSIVRLIDRFIMW